MLGREGAFSKMLWLVRVILTKIIRKKVIEAVWLQGTSRHTEEVRALVCQLVPSWCVGL
jgi:hypothetical protein